MNLSSHDLMWCAQRLPKKLVTLMKANPSDVFIAGGFVRSCVTNEKINDIDLFVPSKEVADRLALVLVDNDERKIHRSLNALTIRRMGPALQFIHRWTYAQPADCIASFDFTIASAAIWWTGTNWTSVCHADFYADLAARRLVYLSPLRNEDAGGSMLRVLKFYQRGYRIPLDSLGAVLARLVNGVDIGAIGDRGETQWAKILTGLLREVDPQIDPDHISHLPSLTGAPDAADIAAELDELRA